MKNCLVVDPWPMMHAVLGDVIRAVDPDIEVIGVLSEEQVCSAWKDHTFGFFVYHLTEEVGSLSSFIRLKSMFSSAKAIILCESRIDLRTISGDFRGVLVIEKSFSYRKVVSRFREFLSVKPDVSDSHGKWYTTEAGINIRRRLSKKQIEVMELASRGGSTKEIARDLGISTETVKTHLSESFRRLGVLNRSAAVMKFMDMKENSDA